MGKVDRLRNRVEPFAALFLALGNVLDPARRRTQIMSLYGHCWFNSQRRSAAPPLSYLGMLFIYGLMG